MDTSKNGWKLKYTIKPLRFGRAISNLRRHNADGAQTEQNRVKNQLFQLRNINNDLHLLSTNSC
ncbi:MAG: hypothetical protein EOO07_12035 [Chitinophagaceae bacterium]|nr:MAG: hypothetical protein EOO07_12035 [Chitinophagaceae bacterium]